MRRPFREPGRGLIGDAMRLYAYEDRHGEPRIGALTARGLLTGSRLDTVTRGPSLRTWQSICCLVNDPEWAQGFERMIRRARKQGVSAMDPERRRQLPAIAHGKIVCVGLNYGDHAKEGGRAVPDRPMLFSKFSNAIIGDG